MSILSTKLAPDNIPAHPHSVSPVELVNKIATCPASQSKRREKTARKKLKTVIREQTLVARNDGLQAIAVTLTYSKAEDFSSKHISAFMDRLRRFAKKADHTLPYAWVLEKASHLHYHLIVWLPRGFKVPKEYLIRWWAWGSTWIAACRCAADWARYMRKFDGSNSLPNGARLYGYGGVNAAVKQHPIVTR